MKEIKFNVVLTNEMEVLLMGEPKIFTLYLIPKEGAPFKMPNLDEAEVQKEIAKAMADSFRM